ncbi:MAG TPA: DUF3089 domain-containing protein [Gaiellaceae bacterium]|nr:DUF3089 domain-containing protein [Gaiellaceae bacterium]
MLGLLAVMAAASSSSLASRDVPPASFFTAAANAPVARATSDVPRWPVWLCKPGQARDYCNAYLTTTVISSSGASQTFPVNPPAQRPVDCFYVYPTVSDEQRGNSDLQIQPTEAAIAVVQASRFEPLCRVFAPMYHQVTDNGARFHGSYELEYTDVLAAWRDYLAHDNHGRGVVLIGHSEGAFLLKRLIREQIESTAESKLFISAILLGGDVTVANGSDTGGSFRRIPACHSKTQTGCVIAYSSWDHTPPQDAYFQQVDSASQHVLCVNPAAPAGGTAPITPIFPSGETEGIAPDSYQNQALWIAFPGLYTARCVRQGSRAWLLVKRIPIAGDPRPMVENALGPNWGLHPADVSIALGDLVTLVHDEIGAWLKQH